MRKTFSVSTVVEANRMHLGLYYLSSIAFASTIYGASPSERLKDGGKRFSLGSAAEGNSVWFQRQATARSKPGNVPLFSYKSLSKRIRSGDGGNKERWRWTHGKADKSGRSKSALFVKFAGN